MSHFIDNPIYNPVYPLSKPVIDEINNTITYNLLACADLDEKSVTSTNKYSSYFIKGTLTISRDSKKAEIKFDSKAKVISTQYGFNNRGMELSDFAVFNGRLYSCDDKTGIVYEISNEKAIPWVILADGDGRQDKGFKAEWMTVKDEQLFVGSWGKEFTSEEGIPINDYQKWIKVISHTGQVKHLNWTDVYNRMRDVLGYSFPGYLIHEACCWDEINRKWYFLPRKASKEAYDEKKNEICGTNLLISMDENLTNVNCIEIGKAEQTRSFASFKFVPNTNNQLIIAIKSQEYMGKCQTWVNMFDVNGNILVEDILISNYFKCESIEFV